MSDESKSPSLWATTLYYAQGLPFSLVRQVSVVFFKEQGVSLQSLGFISLYGIPWTFKFIWSPFVDQFSKKRRFVEFAPTLGSGVGSPLVFGVRMDSLLVGICQRFEVLVKVLSN